MHTQSIPWIRQYEFWSGEISCDVGWPWLCMWLFDNHKAGWIWLCAPCGGCMTLPYLKANLFCATGFIPGDIVSVDWRCLRERVYWWRCARRIGLPYCWGILSPWGVLSDFASSFMLRGCIRWGGLVWRLQLPYLTPSTTRYALYSGGAITFIKACSNLVSLNWLPHSPSFVLESYMEKWNTLSMFECTTEHFWG